MSFYDYVVNKNPWELENEVGEMYQKFKGKSDMTPCFGYVECIWLSEAFLLYKYLDTTNSKLKLQLAHNVIIPAFHGATVSFFLSLMDVFLKHSGMSKEWENVYTHIKSINNLYNFEFASKETTDAIGCRIKMNQIYNRNNTAAEKNHLDFLKYSLSVGLFVPTIYD